MVEEDIWSSEAARKVDDFEVKISKIKQPLGLSAVEVLSLMEIHQVFLVSKDLYGKGGAMEVVSPRFQGTDDGKEFLVINVVVSFSRDEQLREIRTRMPVAVDIGLEEDGVRDILGCISGDSKGFGKVRKVEDVM